MMTRQVLPRIHRQAQNLVFNIVDGIGNFPVNGIYTGNVCKNWIKEYTNRKLSNILGFTTMIVMTAAAVALIYFQFKN